MNDPLAKVSETLLMGPGPSCVPDDVYRALSLPTIGHLDPDFLKIMDGVKELMRTVMKTNNQRTIPISGTGSAGMEACFANLVEPGDAVLVLVNGVFGMRMADVAGRLGAKVEQIEFEWGTPVCVERVVEAVKTRDYSLLAVVHAETSTGVANPVREIAEVLAGRETLLLVDAVTSLGGMEVDVDTWGVDALYSGT